MPGLRARTHRRCYACPACPRHLGVGRLYNPLGKTGGAGRFFNNNSRNNRQEEESQRRLAPYCPMHVKSAKKHPCDAPRSKCSAWLWGAVARPLQRGQQHDNKDKTKHALKRNKQANKHQKSGLRRRDRGGVKSFFFEARGFNDFMLPGNSTKTQPVLKATSPCVSRAPRISFVHFQSSKACSWPSCGCQSPGWCQQECVQLPNGPPSPPH